MDAEAAGPGTRVEFQEGITAAPAVVVAGGVEPESESVGGVVAVGILRLVGFIQGAVGLDGQELDGAGADVVEVGRQFGQDVARLQDEGVGDVQDDVIVQGQRRSAVSGGGRSAQVDGLGDALRGFGPVEVQVAEQVGPREFHAERPNLVVGVVLVPEMLEIGFRRGGDDHPDLGAALRDGIGDIGGGAYPGGRGVYAAAILHQAYEAHVPAGDGRVFHRIEATRVRKPFEADGDFRSRLGFVQPDVVESGRLGGAGGIDGIETGLFIQVSGPADLADVILAEFPDRLRDAGEFSLVQVGRFGGEIPGDAAGGVVVEVLVQLVHRKPVQALIGLDGVFRLVGFAPQPADFLHAVLGSPMPLQEIRGITLVLMGEVAVGIVHEFAEIHRRERLHRVALVCLPLSALLPESAALADFVAPAGGVVVGRPVRNGVGIDLVLETVPDLVGDGAAHGLAGGRIDP